MGGVCGRPSDTLTASLQQSSGDQTLTISSAKTFPYSQNSLLISRADNLGETYKPADKYGSNSGQESSVLLFSSPLMTAIISIIKV